jgi:hypothetical protein
MKFYLDESGNTGNLGTSNSKKLSFSDQPIFVLSAVGFPESMDVKLFEEFISEIKTKYGIQGEMKSKNLRSNRYEIVLDILSFLDANDCPVFVEVTDKRYYLCVMIVENLVFPSISTSFMYDKHSPEIISALKNGCADHLYKVLSEEIYINYCKTFAENREESLKKFCDLLISYMADLKDEMSEVILKHLKATIVDIDDFKSIYNENNINKFMPFYDVDKSGNKLHVLPNTNSLYNLIMRIQKYCNITKEKTFEIIHDEQNNFKEVFEDNLSQLQSRQACIDSILPESKAKGIATVISKDTSIVFEKSTNNSFLQVADVISGVTMKLFRDSLIQHCDGKLFIQYRQSFRRKTPPAGINMIIPKG